MPKSYKYAQKFATLSKKNIFSDSVFYKKIFYKSDNLKSNLENIDNQFAINKCLYIFLSFLFIINTEQKPVSLILRYISKHYKKY